MSVGGCCFNATITRSGVPHGLVIGPLLFSMFTVPVRTLINSFGINYHQFADDSQLYTVNDPDYPHCLALLTACADTVTNWHIRRDHLLNPSNWVAGTRQPVTKFNTSNWIAVSGFIVPFSSKLRELGVNLCEELTFDENISRIVRACNYPLRALQYIRLFVFQDTATTIACLLVCTKLDYCNAILYGVTKQDIGRLQHVQNSLARVVRLAPCRSSASRLHCTCTGSQYRNK